MNKSSHQRKSVERGAASIGRVSFGAAWKRAASPEDFPGEWQTLPVTPKGSREG